MTTLFRESVDLLGSMTRDISDIQREVDNLEYCVSKMGILDFEAFDIQKQLQGCQEKVEGLQKSESRLRNEFETLSAQGFFTKSELDEISERWSYMVVKGQSLSSALDQTANLLLARNIWAFLICFLTDLMNGVDEFLFEALKFTINVAQKVLNGVKTVLFLPPWK